MFPNKSQVLAGASAGAKQEDGGKFGAAHIVNFSVQYACAGICRHFLGAVCFAKRACEHGKTNVDKRPPLLFQYLFNHLSCFGG